MIGAAHLAIRALVVVVLIGCASSAPSTSSGSLAATAPTTATQPATPTASSAAIVPSGTPTVSATVPLASPSVGPPPVEFLWAAKGGGTGINFPGPEIALDPGGRIWVPDTGNSRFAIFNPDGTFVEYWEHRGTDRGQFILDRANGDGFGAIAFAPDGSFYVLDVGNHRVEHFDPQRKFIGSWGSFGTAQGQFIDAIGIAVDSTGVVYVLDDKRNVVERYDSQGTVLGDITAYPSTVAVPGYDSGSTFIVDARGNIYTGIWRVHNLILKMDPSGSVLQTFGSSGSGPGQFSGQPGPGAVGADSRLFVANGAAIQIFAGDGTYESTFLPPGLTGTTDGFVTALLLDGMGNGYITESTSNLVEKFHLLAP